MEWIAAILFVLVCFLAGVIRSQLATIEWLLESSEFAWEKIQEIIQDEFIVKDDSNGEKDD